MASSCLYETGSTPKRGRHGSRERTQGKSNPCVLVRVLSPPWETKTKEHGLVRNLGQLNDYTYQKKVPNGIKLVQQETMQLDRKLSEKL